MKKLTALALCFAMLILSFASCANTSHDDDTDTNTETEAVTNTDTTEAPETEAVEEEPEYYAYLFAFFTGNEPDQERIYFSVSTDGYKYKVINKNSPVVTSKSGTRCVRDPYIFRGEDGYYYMIATDMKSSLGWSSNRDLISWRSEDLINWTDETIIEIDGTCKTTKGTTRAWAPQAIWDPDRGEYMIYFALCSNATKGATVMYYAYSPDMKTLSTDPELLFAPSNGNSAIDADIIYHDGLYYMYFKDETSGGIKLTTSDRLNGGYSWTKAKLVSPANLAVEGSTIYKLFNGDGWLLISDAYTSGYFVMEHTTDLKNFTELKRSEYRFNFNPRHGSVIPITKAEYDALLEAFPIR